MANLEDLDRIDTTPGCGGLFAPPADVVIDDYTKWVKHQASSPLVLQASGVLLFRMHNPRCEAPVLIGPYAEALRVWLQRVDQHLRSCAKAVRED